MNTSAIIKFKSKKSLIFIGIFFLLVALLFEVSAVIGFKEDGTDGVIAIVIISVIFVGGSVLAGIYSIYSYFLTGKKLRNALKQYGEENIRRNIDYSTIRTYKNLLPSCQVYFTNKLVVDPDTAILDYNEISMIYKHVRHVKNVPISSLAFSLVSGETYFLCQNIRDDEIMDIIRLCYLHNPKILFGYTKGNRETHKNRVEQYKAGTIVLPTVDLNAVEPAAESSPEQEKMLEQILPTPWEWTPVGRKHETGKALLFLGTFVMIFSICLTLGVPLILNSSVDKKINAVSEKEREELLSQGCKEYRTVGRYFERDINYNFGNVRFDLQNLYLYELEGEDEICLGILDRNDGIPLNSSECAGIHIFSKEEPSMEIVNRETGVYQTLIIKKDNIVAVYGIPSKDSETTKILNTVLAVVIGIPMFIIGSVMLIVGSVKKKKYRRS